MKYIPRIVDEELETKLKSRGAIYIDGPKWCGKTTTAEKHAKSVVYMQDEDSNNLAMAEIKPSELLKGKNPRLIDEWQMAPKLWDAIRFSVDQREGHGLYIMTGSVSVKWKEKKHSGMGRMSRIRMRTMSLWESGNSTGEVRLCNLFQPDDVSGHSDLDLDDIADLVTRGGWPGAAGFDSQTARGIVAEYCDLLLDSEIMSIDGRNRSKDKMKALLKSLSRNTSTQVSNAKLIEDIEAHEGKKNSVSVNTISDYLSVLERANVTEDLEAWSTSLRSKDIVRSSPTRHMTDPAIAAYFLNAKPANLKGDLKTFGTLFESLVIRDLRVYAQSIGGEVYHYRDSRDLEADAIVLLDDGRWGAIEVKLGPSRVDEAADHLKTLAERVDNGTEPSFLAVIIGWGYAYTRPDGVHVIPIGCLRN
ncbi:MAG: DUF4143 domain-containing protein [Thermoplasmata archaeon]|nr:DUF4143 domain-containing protein [Thermoplasmata archaeon]